MALFIKQKKRIRLYNGQCLRVGIHKITNELMVGIVAPLYGVWWINACTFNDCLLEEIKTKYYRGVGDA